MPVGESDGRGVGTNDGLSNGKEARANINEEKEQHEVRHHNRESKENLKACYKNTNHSQKRWQCCWQ